MPRVVITLTNPDETFTLAQRAALELLTHPVSERDVLHFRRASNAGSDPNVQFVFNIDFAASGASSEVGTPVLILAADTANVPEIAREFPSIRPSGYDEDGTEIFTLQSGRASSGYPAHLLIYD